MGVVTLVKAKVFVPSPLSVSVTFTGSVALIPVYFHLIPVGEGTVTIHQDAKISALLGVGYVKSEGAEPKVLKARGYRVQVYAGNNSRIARTEANEVADKIKSEFPEMSVYAYFQPPRWLCRVGDYRSIEEADAAMRRLKATGKFKEVSIVREQINIPID